MRSRNKFKYLFYCFCFISKLIKYLSKVICSIINISKLKLASESLILNLWNFRREFYQRARTEFFWIMYAIQLFLLSSNLQFPQLSILVTNYTLGSVVSCATLYIPLCHGTCPSIGSPENKYNFSRS